MTKPDNEFTFTDALISEMDTHMNYFKESIERMTITPQDMYNYSCERHPKAAKKKRKQNKWKTRFGLK
jgi:hypothetical protein